MTSTIIAAQPNISLQFWRTASRLALIAVITSMGRS